MLLVLVVEGKVDGRRKRFSGSSVARRFTDPRVGAVPIKVKSGSAFRLYADRRGKCSKGTVSLMSGVPHLSFLRGLGTFE
jgi:hypothetical protein